MHNIFFETAHAAGVIEDATPISEVLLNALDFLLSVFGILAILSLAVAGILYVISSGDEHRVALAKKAALASVIGLAGALSGIVIIRQLAGFF